MSSGFYLYNEKIILPYKLGKIKYLKVNTAIHTKIRYPWAKNTKKKKDSYSSKIQKTDVPESHRNAGADYYWCNPKKTKTIARKT